MIPRKYNNNYNNTSTRTCACEPLTIRLNCIPPTATAQQKGAFVCGGRIRFYTKRNVRASENFLAALLMPHRPPRPFDCPVALEAFWTFPYRKTERRGVVKAEQNIPHTSRPDLDNLEKGLLDVLTRLNFWTDDSLVCAKATGKAWGAKPGIYIDIRPAV